MEDFGDVQSRHEMTGSRLWHRFSAARFNVKTYNEIVADMSLLDP